MVNPLLALENYAKHSSPKSLPTDVYLMHDDQVLTIFDGYPKAKYHFLILPRLPSGFASIPSASFVSLHTLLSTCPPPVVLSFLQFLLEKSNQVHSLIEEQMQEEYGTTWEVQVGFHAVESMRHLHCHVVSTDFVSERMKHKKHWNSFHPSLGFFIHLSDLIDALETHISTRSNDSSSSFKLESKMHYENLLKEELKCHVKGCGMTFKSFPKLKEHLKSEWERAKKKGKMLKKEVEEKVEGMEVKDDGDIEGVGKANSEQEKERKRGRGKEEEEGAIVTKRQKTEEA